MHSYHHHHHHHVSSFIKNTRKHTGPWLNVTYFFVGAYAGNKYVQLERELVEDINQICRDKGLPPMVGTNTWIRYSPQE